jgi:hypothetical protein
LYCFLDPRFSIQYIYNFPLALASSFDVLVTNFSIYVSVSPLLTFAKVLVGISDQFYHKCPRVTILIKIWRNNIHIK